MVAIFLSFAFLAGAGFGVAGVMLAGAGSILVLIRNRRAASLAVLAVVVALTGLWRAADPPPELSATGGSETLTVSGEVASYPQTSVRGLRFSLSGVLGDTADAARICVNATPEWTVSRGATVAITGELTELRDLSKRTQAALSAAGCQAAMAATDIVNLGQPSLGQRIVNAVRERIDRAFQRAAPGDTGALMTGLVTGDDSALSFGARDAFLATGTTHITAVSGANFALILLIASILSTGPGMRRNPRWMALILVTIWSYALIVGLPPSTMRAALTATMAVLALRFGRSPDFLTLTFVAAAMQVAWRPEDLHRLSFQLSFAATLALVLVFSGPDSRNRHLSIGILSSAIAANLATIPVLAYHLDVVTPASFPANAVISLPVLVAFPLSAAAAAAALFSQTLGSALAIFAAVPSKFILRLVEAGDNLLPSAIQLGSVSLLTTGVLVLICWGTVLVMSHDARMMLSRGWK